MNPTYFLTTERVGFRRWAVEDLPLALGLWGDPKVTRLIDARGQLSEDQVRERLLREIATQASNGVQYWPVFLLVTGEHLGCAGLRPYRVEQGTYEIGVHLRPRFWGQGYAAEAALAVTAHAFGPLGAKALFAGHNPNNETSRRLLAKLGFRYTHDEFYPPTGLNHPSYLLTGEEFHRERKEETGLIAITRSPGPELARCELTHLERQPIDIDRARSQHRAYQDALRGAGIRLVALPADPGLPDGVFVEDTAVVLDELAVITSPAPVSRRGEWPAIASALQPFRHVVRLSPETFLEGGDVLRVGRTLYVGQGGRTTEAGLRALEEIVRPLGYAVVPVRLGGCLHLKSACCALDEETLLVNRCWLDSRAFSGLRLVEVPADEPAGANVLPLPGATLISAACPRTAESVCALGHPAVRLDVSELHKAEAGAYVHEPRVRKRRGRLSPGQARYAFRRAV